MELGERIQFNKTLVKLIGLRIHKSKETLD